MIVTKDGIILSTGKTVYAYGGVLGLHVGEEPRADYRIYGGWDDVTNVLCPEFLEGLFFADDIKESDLTNAEAIEIADYMIHAWEIYRMELTDNSTAKNNQEK